MMLMDGTSAIQISPRVKVSGQNDEGLDTGELRSGIVGIFESAICTCCAQRCNLSPSNGSQIASRSKCSHHAKNGQANLIAIRPLLRDS